MSGRGKGGKVKAKAKSRSSRAGLQFPVGRIHRLLRKGNYATRVGAGAPVYLAHCKKAFSEQECMNEEVIIKSCVSKKCVWIILDHIPILVMATITLKSTCVIFKSLL